MIYHKYVTLYCFFFLFLFIGYVCEAHNNPADFFLDVINGDSTAVASVADMADQYGGKSLYIPSPRRDNIFFRVGVSLGSI